MNIYSIFIFWHHVPPTGATSKGPQGEKEKSVCPSDVNIKDIKLLA